MAIITARGLTKEFKIFHRREGLLGAFRDLFWRDYHTVRAVDAIDLSVERGEMVGYIGPNGAGKSTTIKMLTGILVPSGGHLTVNGMIPYRDRDRFTRDIGVVFGQRSQLWWDIAVIESFRLLRRIYGVPQKEFEQRQEQLTEMLQLGDLLHIPVRKLSLGQRMRCELSAALLHNPSLLFLDEPTIGLDVVAKANIRDFLKEINRQMKTTILLTTHDLGDIEALCSRVVIIDKGRLVYDGGLPELQSRWGGQRILTIQLSRPVEVDEVKALLPHLPVYWQSLDPYRLQGIFHREDIPPSEILSRFLPHFPVADLGLEEISIEEVVRRIYGSEGGNP